MVAAMLAAVTATVSAVLITTPAPAAAAPREPAASRGDQWHLEVLDIRQAHRVSRGEGVVVAVVDGGVDAAHPELAGQVLPGNGFGIDAAADGHRDDDEYGHGTAMAGIIAARDGGPGDSVVGIAPEARILPVSTGGEADTLEVARAVRWAADNGADVINLSLGSPGAAFRMETRAIEYALARDVVVVAAAGNLAPEDEEINSPANIPGVIAVTGSTSRGGFWSGSVQGPEAAIAAPAPGIRSPVPTRVSADGLDTGSGTSNSAAVVSGVAALVRSHFPDLDAANTVNRLIRTAVDAGPPGRDEEFGFGIVDPVAALTAEVGLVTVNPLLISPGTQGTSHPRAKMLNDAAAAVGGDAGPGAAPDAPDSGVQLGPPVIKPAPDGGEPTPAEPAPIPADDSDDGVSARTWLIGLAVAVPVGVVAGMVAHHLAGRARTRPRARHGPASAAAFHAALTTTASGSAPAGSVPPSTSRDADLVGHPPPAGSRPPDDPGDDVEQTLRAGPPPMPPPPTWAYSRPGGVDAWKQVRATERPAAEPGEPPGGPAGGHNQRS